MVISASFASSDPTHRGAGIGAWPSRRYGLHTIPTGSSSAEGGTRGGCRFAFFCNCRDMFLGVKSKLVNDTVNRYPYAFIVKTAHAVIARTRCISSSFGCEITGAPNMSRSCASCTACRRIIQLSVAFPRIFRLCLSAKRWNRVHFPPTCGS